MKKYKLRNTSMFLLYFVIILFQELIFKILNNNPIFNISLFYIIVFSGFISLLLSIVNTCFSDKTNKILFYISLIVILFVFALNYCTKMIFGFCWDISLLWATDQVMEFAGDGVKLVLQNIFGVLILAIPIILLLPFNSIINFRKRSKKYNFIKLTLTLIIYIVLVLTFEFDHGINNAHELFYDVNNIEISLKKFGVLHTNILDVKRNIFGFEEKLVIDNDKGDKPVDKNPNIKEYQYNNLDIDFDSLISKENDDVIKSMHEYFKNETGSLQNEYTGKFKDKNLILFMAESFNEIAVSKELTPTLYKLIHSGFIFNDYYTPTISSTIGGEFQEITGLVAASGFLAPWKKGTNSFPFGIATTYQDMGYNTFAYHNNSYTFQNRNKYLKALGFKNFLGCYNGLEKRINCKMWPESDIEMIDTTFNDYINSDKPFFTYYVTVSGHGDYNWNNSAIARKYRDLVKDLPYSEKVKVYLAANIELDRALELLINKLTESGKLDDTVIALVGDHYPYYLKVEEVNEVIPNKDEVVEINHSNFILWNNKMEDVEVDKVGSQIDVLPTLYNLFGVNYDSRLIIGKDILSNTPGLAIFGNRSWVSDKGTYFSSSNKFIPKEGVKVEDDYVVRTNQIVNNKMNMSKLILTKDYYKYFNNEE